MEQISVQCIERVAATSSSASPSSPVSVCLGLPSAFLWFLFVCGGGEYLLVEAQQVVIVGRNRLIVRGRNTYDISGYIVLAFFMWWLLGGVAAQFPLSVPTTMDLTLLTCNGLNR